MRINNALTAAMRPSSPGETCSPPASQELQATDLLTTMNRQKAPWNPKVIGPNLSRNQTLQWLTFGGPSLVSMCPYRESSSPRSAFVQIRPLTVTFHVDDNGHSAPDCRPKLSDLLPLAWTGIMKVSSGGGARNNRRKRVIALGAGQL